MIRLLGCMMFSGLVVWVGFLGAFFAGENYLRILPSIESRPEPGNWHAISGESGLIDEEWRFIRPGRFGKSQVGVLLPGSIPESSVDSIEIAFSNGRFPAGMRLGWASGFASIPSDWAPVEKASQELGVVDASLLQSGSGSIRLVVIEAYGGLPPSLSIEGIRLVPAKPGILELHDRIISEWFSFSPWSQRSINDVGVAETPVVVAPTLAVATWVIVTSILLWFVSGSSCRSLFFRLLLVVFCGWLLLDLRWQTDLLWKGSYTIQRFSGLGWEARRLSDLDGELFAFSSELKERLGQGDRRVFILGEGSYWKTRARYHLLPWSTRVAQQRMTGEWTRLLQSGDVLVAVNAEWPKSNKLDKSSKGIAHEYLDIDLGAASGRDSLLRSGKSGRFLELDSKGEELIRVDGLDVTSEAFYRVNLDLRSGGEKGRIRVLVVGDKGNGERVAVGDREIAIGSSGHADVSVPFVLPSEQKVTILVKVLSGSRIRCDSVKVEQMVGDELVWLESNESEPYLVARPVRVQHSYRAYEVL